MIGRDFTHLGTTAGIYSQYGDGFGFPFKGQIKPVFIDNSTVAILDQDNGIHVQRLGGQRYYICPPPSAEETSAAKAEDTDSDEEESSVVEVAEDIRHREIIPAAICVVPHLSTHVAVADINNFIKICNKTSWSTDDVLGGIGSALGKFARISAMSSFVCDNETLYVVAELGNQRVQIVDETCLPVVSVAGNGILPGQFRDPVAIAVHLDTSNVKQRVKTAGETALAGLTGYMPSTPTSPVIPVGGGRLSGFGRNQPASPTGGNARLTISTDFAQSAGTGRSRAASEVGGRTLSPMSPQNKRDSPGSSGGPPTPTSPGALFRQTSGMKRIAGRRATASAPITGFGDIKPHWYHGICKLRDLKSRIGRKMEVGRYALGKRHDDHSLYDFLFVAQYHSDAPATFEHVVFRVRDSDGRIFNCTDELNNCANPEGYGCIWEAMCSRYSKHLRHDTDPRPFVSIAVADSGNKRVQLFKYYYTIVPDLYIPALEYFTIIGGSHARVLALNEPSGVAYTATGELVICDSGIKKVVILSKRLDIIALLPIGFELAKNNFRQSTPHSRPGTRAGRASSRPGTRSGRMELGRPAALEKGSTHDYKACSVAVSDDGKIAIGFKSGGLLVYKPFRTFQMGSLEMLPTKLFLIVLEFCTYGEVVSLRNCCRFLHDFTKERRSLWALTGMRVHHCQRAVYSYIKWAKTVEGVPGLSYSVPCVDKDQKQVCTRFLEMKCENMHCVKPHTMPVYDYKFLSQAKDNAIDIVSFYGIICFTFSSTFLWKNEIYIKELFEFYCVVRKTCVRVDPMTRKNEVIRDQHYEKIKALNFAPYLVIMTLLEEDFRGLKSLTQHPLFKNRIVAKQETALMASIRELMPKQIEDVVLYHDPFVEKYAPVINIPATANKTKKFRCLPGMATDRSRGQSQTDVQHHIQTFEMVGDRAGSLLNKLFS